jgi:hypothetical protein
LRRGCRGLKHPKSRGVSSAGAFGNRFDVGDVGIDELIPVSPGVVDDRYIRREYFVTIVPMLGQASISHDGGFVDTGAETDPVEPTSRNFNRHATNRFPRRGL